MHTLQHMLDIGDRVAIDSGDVSGHVTAVLKTHTCTVEYQVSWLHAGVHQQVWLPEWRLRLRP